VFPVRFTYDEIADAVFIYMVDEIATGEAKRSALVPLEVPGASILVELDEGDRALGVEILGASRMFTAEALAGFRVGRSEFRGRGPA
jgi:uncharacterized protein YuzE